MIAVTGSVPFSEDEEAFVQDELTEMLHQGAVMQVVPMRRRMRSANAAAVRSGLADVSHPAPVLSFSIVLGALGTLARRPRRSVLSVARALRASGSRRNLQVNLATIPKALWLAGLVRRWGADHLHAYWLSHTATAAMVAGTIEQVPWSATGYRWDIDAANALELKLSGSDFIRCADELGQSQLSTAAAEVNATSEVVLVRTGVHIPERSAWERTPVDPLLLCCPAAMVEKKGHRVLLSAVAAIHKEHPDVELHLFGDGPLRAQIESQVDDLGLRPNVVLHGNVTLDELQAFFRERRPVCVLPSIRASDGQQEGIPVTLVEAMANGSPVVSTRSGSIAALVTPGTGTLVEPGDHEALAAAIGALIADPRAADSRCHAAADRLLGEFDLHHTAATMLGLVGDGRRSTG